MSIEREAFDLTQDLAAALQALVFPGKISEEDKIIFDDKSETVSSLLNRADTLLINQSSFKADEPCTWELDHGDNAWAGTCGSYWLFENEGPKENGVKFCPECGKPCVVIEPPKEKDDE
jgi:hypothetical protein